MGALALQETTTGSDNTGLGYRALYLNTTGQRVTAVGSYASESLTTAVDVTTVGYLAGRNITTASSNTIVGAYAADALTTGNGNTIMGRTACRGITSQNGIAAFGNDALENATGIDNTAIGSRAGSAMTSGSKNTILGRYNGNQGGLDIRTSSNHIVLSDGDGNPRLYLNASGEIVSTPTYNNTTGAAANVYIASNSKLYRSTSSARYKNTIEDATFGLAEAMALRPVTYKGNNDGDTVFGGLIAEEVHDAGLTEFVQYNADGEPDSLAYGNMVSLCIKAIQELSAENAALTARIEALES